MSRGHVSFIAEKGFRIYIARKRFKVKIIKRRLTLATSNGNNCSMKIFFVVDIYFLM